MNKQISFEMKQEIIDTILKLRGLEESTDIITFSVDRSIHIVGTYIRTFEIPKSLLYILVEIAMMVSDRMELQSTNGAIQSMKQGEVSISFAQNNTDMELCKQFAQELNAYRKLI